MPLTVLGPEGNVEAHYVLPATWGLLQAAARAQELEETHMIALAAEAVCEERRRVDKIEPSMALELCFGCGETMSPFYRNYATHLEKHERVMNGAHDEALSFDRVMHENRVWYGKDCKTGVWLRRRTA